jgi:PAS domain S-box-containing protein
MNENPSVKKSNMMAVEKMRMDYQKIKNENETLKLDLVSKNQEIQEIRGILSSYNTECDRIEYALQNIVLAMNPLQEESFFVTLVRQLGKILNVSLVILGEIKTKDPLTWETLVVCEKGEIKKNFSYDITGTPCEKVYQRKEAIIYPQGLNQLNNYNHLILGEKAESYIGFPLITEDQEIIGSLCLIDEKPIVDQYWSMSILKIFASQITSELKNKQTKESLIKLQKKLESQIEEKDSELLSATLALQTEISEKEEVKTALINSKETYLSLVNSLQEVVFQRDIGGIWIFVNTTWTNLTGFSAEETIGRHFSEFLHPEDCSTCLDCIHPLIENSPCRKTQVRYRTKTGESLWMEVNKQIIFNDQGEAIGLSGTLRDITAQKKAQEALEKEKKQLHHLISNAPVAIAMFDLNMNYVTYSHRWLKEFDLKETSLVGRSHYEIFPNVPPERIELYKKVLQGEYLSKNEDSLILHNGKKLYYKWAMNPWFVEDNQIGGMIMVIQGINELVEARNSALENAKIKSQFLATMSHEIRTPMNGVIGMAELLLKTTLDETQKDFVQTLYQSGKNLLTIINEILDFSKLEAGEMHLEKVDFSINSCLEEVVDLFGIKAQEKQLELLTLMDYQVENLNVQGDPTRLRQILLNLVGNALKFTEKGSVIIKVALEKESATNVKLRFQVEDTGIGIPQKHQEKIFESFSQMDASTTRNYGGTGLGLAICKQIITIMGGEIGVKSQVNRGSIFWFTVTLEKQKCPLSVTIPVQKYLKGLKLLIISHHVATKGILESYANSWGMEAKSANTIQEGIFYFNQEKLKGKPYHIAIIEMQYSDLDQEIFAHLTKLDPQLASLQCVWLVSLEQQNQINNPSHHYLFKPIKTSKLSDLLIHIAQDFIKLNKGKYRNITQTKKPEQLTKQNQNRSNKSEDYPKILLVEDTPINQKVILNQLSILGYTADCVNNGKEALNILNKETYDLILMDCLMPNLDGYETTKTIRKKEGNIRHTNIIAMTANAMTGEREKCLKAGMDDYISKPIELDNLEQVLCKWIKVADGKSLSNKNSLNIPAKIPEISSLNSPIDQEKFDEIVKGDLDFKLDLLKAFIDDAPIYVEDIKKAIKQRDFALIIHRSHQLKGASSMVAVHELPELAKILQSQGEAEKLENEKELIAKIEQILERVREFVEK